MNKCNNCKFCPCAIVIMAHMDGNDLFETGEDCEQFIQAPAWKNPFHEE